MRTKKSKGSKGKGKEGRGNKLTYILVLSIKSTWHGQKTVLQIDGGKNREKKIKVSTQSQS